MYELRAVALIALLLLQAACGGAPSVEEGYADVTGGRVWYRIVGARSHAPPATTWRPRGAELLPRVPGRPGR